MTQYPWPAPTPFGRYILRQVIAEGGMAEIFLAELRGHSDFSKLIALKRMLPHLCKEEEFVTMFMDEARLASRLSHPNVVQIFDFGQEEGRYYIAMEYLAGETLASVMKHAFGSGRPLPIQVVLQIMAAASDGLHYAHTFTENGVPLQIVHRDISPSNIVVTYQGGVKVVDFGIARAVDRKQEQTQTGVVKGKYPYCSPEQLRSEALDARSDLFSLGIVFHELTTGHRLFRKKTEAESIVAVLSETVAPPSKLRPGLPQGFDEVVLKSLERDPNKRYQSGLEMRRDIEKLMSGPPIRLDEYMSDLFGEERVRERSKISSNPGFKTATPSGDSWPSLPNAALKAPIPRTIDKAKAEAETGELPAYIDARGEPDLTRAVSAEEEAKLLARDGVGTAKPKSKSRAPLFIALAVPVLLLAAAGGYFATRPKPAEVVAVGPTGDSGGAPKATAAATSTVVIDTLPRGATVTVGGRKLEGVTPLEVPGLTAGQVVVQAELAAHMPATRVVEVAEGEKKSVVLQLEPAPAKLSLTAPNNARVFIDDRDEGEKRQFELAAGEHTLKVVLPGHQSFDRKVSLAPGEDRTIEAKLTAIKKSAAGSLSVSCVPWCRVIIDGKDIGKVSPIVDFPIAAGSHKLRLEHTPTGRSKEVALTVKPGQSVRESANFRSP